MCKGGCIQSHPPTFYSHEYNCMADSYTHIFVVVTCSWALSCSGSVVAQIRGCMNN